MPRSAKKQEHITALRDSFHLRDFFKQDLVAQTVEEVLK
jgi:hypothetical protein